MPTGGELTQAIGLQLQPQTPGNTDNGNAHISGVMVATGFNTRDILNSFSGNPGLYGDYVVFGRDNTITRNGGFPGARSVIIGTHSNDGQTLVDGVSHNVNIGWQNNTWKNNAICIGYATTCGKNDAGTQDGCIAIGSQASALGANNIAMGQNVSADATRGLVICSGGPNSTIGGTDIIAIGQTVNAAGRTNFLFINSATGTYTASAADDNSILIGNASQTKVTIGPYVITAGLSAPGFIQTASVTVGNTVTETTLTGAGAGNLAISAGRIAAGTTVRIKARGYITDTGTPTLQLRMKLAPAGTFVDLGTFTLPTITGTQGWTFDGEVTTRTIGAGGAAIAQGTLTIGGATPVTLTSSTNNATGAINTTITQTGDLTAQWGTAAPANTLTCTNLIMELVG
jgi:hypothetical protein